MRKLYMIFKHMGLASLSSKQGKGFAKHALERWKKLLTKVEKYERLGIMRKSMSWPKVKEVVGWRGVERSFRQHRDRRVVITLPKVSCLEEEDPALNEASANRESLPLAT
jgi:hypothetical protein